MTGVPYFSAEYPRGGEHKFLRAGVVAIGGEGSNEGRADAGFEADSGKVNHRSQLL